MVCSFCPARPTMFMPMAMCQPCAVDYWQGAVAVAASQSRERRSHEGDPLTPEQAQMCLDLERLAGLESLGRSNEERKRDERDELIREAYANGALQKDIAKAHGLIECTISRIVSGVVRRHRTSRRQNLPPDTLAGIRQALHYGISRAEIAKRYDVSLSLLSKCYVWAEDKRKQRAPTRLTPDVCLKVQKLFRQGLTKRAIARQTKLSESTVYAFLRKQKIAA